MRMEDSLRIRDAVPEDAPSLTELIGELGYPSSLEEVTERLGKIFGEPGMRTLVAELAGEVAGFIGLDRSYGYERNGCYVRVAALVVSHRFRNRGIGRLLMAAAEEWARAEGATAVILNSGFERQAAHRFYHKRGFTIKSYGFYKEFQPDGVISEKKLKLVEGA